MRDGRLFDSTWYTRIGELARTIGSDDFHVGIARLLGGIVQHHYIVIVRYPLAGLPDILFTENFGQHLIEYYLKHAYKAEDPFYAYWSATGRSCVLPLREAIAYAEDREFYRSIYQKKAGIADEVAIMLRGMGGACVSIFLGLRKGRFSTAELERLRTVFPAVDGFHKAHLGRLLTRLVEKARPVEPSFPRPTLVVTRTGDAIYSNPAWKRALRADPGLARLAADAPAARNRTLRLPSGDVLHVEKLDTDFPLAPGGCVLILEPAGAVGDEADRSRQAAADFERLTPREREIVRLTIAGTGAADMAKRLRLSKGTIKNHRLRIYRKLGIASAHSLYIRFLPLAKGLRANTGT